MLDSSSKMSQLIKELRNIRGENLAKEITGISYSFRAMLSSDSILMFWSKLISIWSALAVGLASLEKLVWSYWISDKSPKLSSISLIYYGFVIILCDYCQVCQYVQEYE